MTPWRTLTRPWRALWRGDEGAAAVELALFIPILLLFVMGAVDFGRAMVTGIAVSNAVRAGAQYGAQSTVTSRDTAGMRIAAIADFDTARYGALTIDSASMRCGCLGDAEALRTRARCAAGPVCPPTGAPTYPRAYVKVSAHRAVSLFVHYPGFGSTVTASRTAELRAQ